MTGLKIYHSIMTMEILLLVFLLGQEVTMDPFQPVSSSCKYWDSLSLYTHRGTKLLHCILDENGQPGLVNASWKWVATGLCPFFNRHSEEIHMKPCDTELGECPNKEIYSFQGVKYSACYRALDRVEAAMEKENKDTISCSTGSKKDTKGYNIGLIGIHVVASVILILQLAILGIYIYEKFRLRRRRGLTRGSDVFRPVSVNDKFPHPLVVRYKPKTTPSNLRSHTEEQSHDDAISVDIQDANGNLRSEDGHLLDGKTNHENHKLNNYDNI